MNLDGITTVLGRLKKRFPQQANRLSNLDDPCERRLYYRRAEWDKAATVDDGLQGIFETGNRLEPIIMEILGEIGRASNPPWRIVGNQQPVKDSLMLRYQITGTIDGILQRRIPEAAPWANVAVCDVKTMSPHVFAAINSYEDLGKYPWTRSYRGQLMGYALGMNLTDCVIIAVNKSNLYDIKAIEFPLDLDYMDGLLEKAERVNMAVSAGTPPAGINTKAECSRCPFLGFCCPPLETGGNMEIVDNPELEAILEALDRLEASADQYSALEKERDALLQQGKDVCVGRFKVSWKKVEGTRKPSAGGSYSYWRKSIEKIA